MSQTRLDLDDESAVEFVDEQGYPEAEPVTIRFERHHAFEGPKKSGSRCKVCKRKQGWIEHLGFPEQLENDSGTHPMQWQDQKKMWQLAFGEALHLSGMPRASVYQGSSIVVPGVESVVVMMRYTFGDTQRRDRDNLVYPTNKFFGDTLVRGRFIEKNYEEVFDAAGYNITDYKVLTRGNKVGKPVVVADPMGGWIPDDRWDRYEVIETQAVYVKDVYALDIMIQPSFRPPPAWPPAEGS